MHSKQPALHLLLVLRIQQLVLTMPSSVSRAVAIEWGHFHQSEVLQLPVGRVHVFNNRPIIIRNNIKIRVNSVSRSFLKYFDVFTSLVYFNGAMFYCSLFLPCCPAHILISTLIFTYEIVSNK